MRHGWRPVKVRQKGWTSAASRLLSSQRGVGLTCSFRLSEVLPLPLRGLLPSASGDSPVDDVFMNQLCYCAPRPFFQHTLAAALFLVRVGRLVNAPGSAMLSILDSCSSINLGLC